MQFITSEYHFDAAKSSDTQHGEAKMIAVWIYTDHEVIAS